MTTETATHTPGPWLVLIDHGPGADERFDGPMVAYNANDLRVFGDSAKHQIKTDGSGTLLVISLPQAIAAPDLLAACKRLVHVTDEALSAAFDEEDTRYALDDARRAIAAAQEPTT